MDTLISNYRKIENFFGNLKFAVVIIALFAIFLGYGTFMESYHGTEYANRLVYKSIFFMLIQFCMFLSIFFATMIRLPPRKHLYGFYVIHTGLIILFLGSFITYQSGIDGNITLYQTKSPVRFNSLMMNLKYNSLQQVKKSQLICHSSLAPQILTLNTRA